ncbi:PAS domain S-box protein [Candidatus Sumerlaeota bacterium]|nr:PAS domain S-box protein [Candidatus Sumerlaeota bacterium]
MKDENKTKKQLIQELNELRQRITELEEMASEHFKCEVSLRESEENYSALIKNLNIGIYRNTGGAEGRFLFANPALARIHGYNSVDEFMKVRVSELYYNPEERRTFIEELLKKGFVKDRELHLKRKDGSSFWASCTAQVKYDGNGNIEWIDGIIEDITERKRMEKRMEHLNTVLRAIRNVNQFITQEKDKFRLIQGVCELLVETRGYYNVWIVLQDAEGNITGTADAGFDGTFARVSEQLAQGKLTHCAQLALSQQRVVVIQDTQSECGDCPLLCEHTGRGAMCSRLKYRDKDYGLITVSVPVELVNDREELDLFKEVAGDIAFALHSIELEEKRKQAECALRESEEMFRSISDSAQDAIIMMDNEGNISYWNRAAEKIFGYTKEEVLGKELHILLAPQNYQEAYRRGFAKFRRTGEGTAVGKTRELKAVRKDGTEFPIELSVSGVKLKGKWYAIGILRDITERKKAELAVIEAKRAAEAAAEAKAKFLANMSHEIRTPMNGIIGMCGLLLDTDLDEEQREYAETIAKSANSLLSIINDILDFSKIEAGKLDIEIIEFDLRTTLEDLNDILAIRAQDKGLEYICMIDPEVPSLLEGDPGRLRQILTNLIGNAIKFTEKGEVKIYVTLEDENEEEATIRFAVTDTGVGIPKDKQEGLFEAFTQADASTKRRYGGTGLGLAISRQLVELMGGKIGVESEEGKGSTFWFILPFRKQPVRGESAEDSGEESIGTLEGVHILVVDDNATNRLVLMRLLESWHCRAEEAPDGETALAMLRTAIDKGDPFQIAILDMQMPGMDGEELGQAIKQDEAFNDLVLMMMTSLGRRGDVSRVQELGFSAYLTKPVKQSQLYDCLITLVSKRPARRKSTAKSIITRHTLAEAKKRKVRILIAEDNPTNQLVALRILGKLGYYADAVANGSEVLRALAKIPYDLVLMDVQMPVMDGFEATRRIRDPESDVLNHNIPIIAMTAHALKGDREKCLEAGMDDYVSKPVNPKELAEAIERMLGKVKPSSRSQPSGSAETGKKVFDREALLQRVDGDEELLKEILEVFLKDTPARIKSLKDAVSTKDAESIQRDAHSLKGSAGSVGAVALQELAAELERLGKAKELDSARASELIQKIENAFKELEIVLNKTVVA